MDDLARLPMPWIGLLGSLVAGVATGIGALPVFIRRDWSRRAQVLMLAVAAGDMLGATVFSLLVPAIENVTERTGDAVQAAAVGAGGLLLGAASVWAIHTFVPHQHFIKGREGAPSRRPWSRYWLFVFAITLHNFPEGMSVGVAWGDGPGTGLPVTIGMALQNVPEGLAVAAAMIADGAGRGRAFAVALLTGLVEPIGGLVGAGAVTLSGALLPWGLAFAAGAMLYVISGEIIPETHREGRESLATLSLVVGFAVMMLLNSRPRFGNVPRSSATALAPPPLLEWPPGRPSSRRRREGRRVLRDPPLPNRGRLFRRDPGMSEALPIESVRGEVLSRAREGPVVVSSPTGSGKSTQVPRWLEGRVLVVEPRRVACRSLAQRVAALEGSRLGDAVGYRVRDEARASGATRVVFATPGIALRTFDRVEEWDAVVLDEFHERGLETDLLLALLQERYGGRLLVMSATIEGERVASHLGGVHVAAEGRVHPVEVRYLPEGVLLPEPKGLEQRVAAALDAARDDPGDVLVFLPGKAEIAACAQALSGRADVEVLELHGGLTLEQQARAFEPARRRKVILATNVAETSITLPGIGVVVDAGLVRRTRFHRDRGFLTLAPIAMDSAEQRAGRAGRLGPGVCYRLWSEAAKLEATTPPAIHRESLTPLVLAAAACGADAGALPFLDPPRDYAIEAARGELSALGALDASGALTDRGREMFGLPLDAPLARLLIEAEQTGALEDAVDLVAALSVGRPLFVGARPADEDDDLRSSGCDATALVRAVRAGDPRRHGLHPWVLREARAGARRLRAAYGLPERGDPDAPVDRERLARTALAADPRCVHVARSRGRRVAWSNGGTEIELARESAVSGLKDVEAIAVLDTRALGLGRRDTRVLATCATPVRFAWMARAGLGRDRVGAVAMKDGVPVATIERVYARRVIDTREEVPRGLLAREAVRDLILRGTLFRGALEAIRDRLEAAALAAQLDLGVEPPPPLEEWLLRRLGELGVENAEDVALLSEDDLLPPELPFEVRHVLDQQWPRRLDLGDAQYAVRYDLARRQVTLEMTAGNRQKPPPLSFLPRFEGFRICIETARGMHVLRD